MGSTVGMASMGSYMYMYIHGETWWEVMREQSVRGDNHLWVVDIKI